MSRPSVRFLGGVGVFVLVGCGGPGLPPAGPQPGNVDVGYGSQPKEKVTGAVTSVSGKDATTSPPLRLEELLRGKSAGLQIITRPDGSQALRIRGGNPSQQEGTAEPEPLIIVDGVQLRADGLATALAGLTPDDIRQVDVLKDVASTSIYGTRGAAGVILIATKRR